MSRVLGRHPLVFSFRELHFFRYARSATSPVTLDPDRARRLAADLISNQRNGYFYRHRRVDQFLHEADEVLAQLLPDERGNPGKIFASYLDYEARCHGKAVACEQTPANVFHIADILDAFPNARILIMVRDPRAILLSQKGKWRRRGLGEERLPLLEPLRAWFNYHPIVTARLWRAAVEAGDRYTDHDRVKQVTFESLLHAPEPTVLAVCEWLNLEFFPEMLDVPQWSSSNEPDSSTVGIKPERAERWREGGLTETEIFFCERIARPIMARHGYEMTNARPSPLATAASLVQLPCKLAGALPLNLRNLGNPLVALRQRWSAGH